MSELLGYARVSTTKQDLERQLVALRGAGVPEERIWADKWTSATMARPEWTRLLAYARTGDVIVVHTIDRFGGNLRQMLNTVEDLRERGIRLRTLADPMPIDTSEDGPMAELSLAILSLFAQMRRTYIAEQRAHARAVAQSKGLTGGRPRALDDDTLQAAQAAVDGGMSREQVAKVHGISRATAFRRLTPRDTTNTDDTGRATGQRSNADDPDADQDQDQDQ